MLGELLTQLLKLIQLHYELKHIVVRISSFWLGFFIFLLPCLLYLFVLQHFTEGFLLPSL